MRNLSRIILIFIVGLNTLSCSVQPDPSIMEESSSNDPALASESNSEESPSTKTDTETFEESLSIPEKPISEDGPWLIVESWQGLFAVNPDGSGLTQFVDGVVEILSTRKFITSQRSGYFAYHMSSGNENDTAIRIVSFPSLELVADIPLFTYSDDPDMSAFRAVEYQRSMAFSPDGRHLAFMGVIDGPTSDLYLYSLESGELLQLTSGRTQGYQPVWSPDGKYILHTGADGFGTGAGFETKGIWTARADKDLVKTLYAPTPNAAEMIVDWVDDETFVVYSWFQPCGPNNLRTYNIESGQSAVLWSEPFKEIALDPASKTLVLTTWDDGICLTEAGAGTFFISVLEGNPQKVSEKTGLITTWSPAGEIRIALKSGWCAIYNPLLVIKITACPSGVHTALSIESPKYSPGGMELSIVLMCGDWPVQKR